MEDDTMAKVTESVHSNKMVGLEVRTLMSDEVVWCRIEGRKTTGLADRTAGCDLGTANKEDEKERKKERERQRYMFVKYK